MTSLRTVVLLSCGMLLTAPSLAHADIPPPPGYVERCTVERKEQEGTTCEECDNGPGGGESLERCKEQYEGTEFTYVCKTRGASFWTEVWCDGPPRGEDGCSCSSPSTGITTSAVLTAIVLLGIGLRRRGRPAAR